MRDLYNRKAKLDYWIQRVNTDLHGSDKSDLLKLIEYMQDKERAALWIIRCITALISIRKQLGKPFKDAKKDDIKLILKWMEEKHYKAATNEKFRQILKLFYKTVYADGEYYPEAVKWFSTRLGKEKRGKETNMDLAEFLEEQEVKQLVQTAPTLQKKAFLACMYEAGARVELFFTDVGSRLNATTYELTELDVNNIIDNAKYYSLKLIFQYYLSDLSNEEIAIVLEFLYYVVIKRPFSIGHMKSILNENNFLKEALVKMGNLSREKPLHLFNTTENGIISPFHDIISDAIIRLVQNPDKLLSELSSKNQYLYDQIQKVIDIDLSLPLSGKASKEFLSRYEENLNNSLVYYANTLCVREIANTEKINDETMYMLLSVFIEYLSHKKSEQYNSETIQRIISLLANNEVNYLYYRNKVESQLLTIFEKLGLFIRPMVSLKKYYLQLSCSTEERIKFSSWSHMYLFIKNNIVDEDEVIDIKSHILNLLTSNNARIMNGSWIIVQTLLRFKIINKNDKNVIKDLLRNANYSIRWNSWKYALD